MQVGLEAALFHKKLPPPVRQQALEALRSTAGGRVLVCTDAAARGLDLTSISHVVQADFADNAVDFLHRIGRTARGDRCAAPPLPYNRRLLLIGPLWLGPRTACCVRVSLWRWRGCAPPHGHRVAV